MTGLTVSYPVAGRALRVVDNVSFSVPVGGVLGLVGESGSGKSTVARAVAGLVRADAGSVVVDGKDVTRRRARGQVGMIFQDPYASLNPRMTVRSAVAEVVGFSQRVPRRERDAEVTRLLDLVQLSRHQSDRLPAQLSGGQRQRAAIARALASRPRVLIADEITSALDVSVQAAVLNVMREVLRHTQVATVFISHNLAVVRYLSDEVAVMHAGQLVERADECALFDDPQHPYTRVLIDSVPVLSRDQAKATTLVDGEPPDPHALPSGCRFHPRCPVGPRQLPGREVCESIDPAADAPSRRHAAACHFAQT